VLQQAAESIKEPAGSWSSCWRLYGIATEVSAKATALTRILKRTYRLTLAGDEKKDCCCSKTNSRAEKRANAREFAPCLLQTTACDAEKILRIENSTKKFQKTFSDAFPQVNACASMPSSRLKFFVAVAVLAAL
jgi:hypothetical protein